MVAGLMMLLLGAALHFLPRITYLGRLPGDIHIEGSRGGFYFPIVTCLLVSAVLSLIAWLFKKL